MNKTYAFEKSIIRIIKEYKEGSNEPLDEPLDGDEVDKLVELLRNQINLTEGNLTEEEYLELDEKKKVYVIMRDRDFNLKKTKLRGNIEAIKKEAIARNSVYSLKDFKELMKNDSLLSTDEFIYITE